MKSNMNYKMNCNIKSNKQLMENFKVQSFDISLQFSSEEGINSATNIVEIIPIKRISNNYRKFFDNSIYNYAYKNIILYKNYCLSNSESKNREVKNQEQLNLANIKKKNKLTKFNKLLMDNGKETVTFDLKEYFSKIRKKTSNFFIGDLNLNLSGNVMSSTEEPEKKKIDKIKPQITIRKVKLEKQIQTDPIQNEDKSTYICFKKIQRFSSKSLLNLKGQ